MIEKPLVVCLNDDELAEIKKMIQYEPNEPELEMAEEQPNVQEQPTAEEQSSPETEPQAQDVSETKPEEPEQKGGFGREMYMLLHDLVYILAVVTLMFVFAFRLVGVDGYSMYPTLHHADYLGLLSNVLYTNVEQGDVIVMTVPYFENEPIVKRVIATEGQTVDIDFETGEVFVDGVLQDEKYVNEPTYESYAGIGASLNYPVYVQPGTVFVMGDNRNHSADSRYSPVGLVDEEDILGKVLFIVLPGADKDSGYPNTEKRDFSRIGGVS